MTAGGHFGLPKITFDRISRHFRTIRNFFFHKMAAGGHFGLPKITFDRIYRHFRSIRNLDFFFSQNGWQRPFWMTENHFWSLFSTFQINTQLIFFTKWRPAAILDDRKSLSMDDRKSHFSSFQINTQLLFFWIFFFKMAAGGHFGSPIWTIMDDRKSLSIAFLAISDQYTGGHFGSPICTKNNRVLPLCVINGYAKYEVDRWICDTVRDTTSFLRIVMQNGHQRPFCFPDWYQKS